ncbi:hypothetical protein J5N97_000611 [Dioscorea zingiberensis]|uniref:Uncharacterized protein n=1 Tax=Dioscorea zingiberensis TaxID=325984 RepID=A0A9D5BS83_9LILI|nr:hypothetical protein J5N97_000611 [Dioscorea zingiberensis]
MPSVVGAEVNLKAAESLADPEEYPNLFEDWQVVEDREDVVQEEAVEVDADDSTDGTVLVNGNEGEEEWGTNNAGTPST